MNADQTDYSYYIGEKKYEDLHYLKPLNKQKEINKVSIEEALNLNSNAYKRQMVMDTLNSDNVLDYIDVLKKALNNTDSETVHYATAVIMETQRKLVDSLLKLRKMYQNDRDDRQAIINYEEALSNTIFSGVFDENNLVKYYEWYKELSDRLLKEDWALESFYDNRIKLDFVLEDYKHAKETCEQFKKQNPYSELMVNRYMEYCILTNDRKLLNQFMEELKSLPVKLTQDTLQYVNLFSC
jgi:nuclear transport factor 2 (NTF2) superfamily protein